MRTNLAGYRILWGSMKQHFELQPLESRQLLAVDLAATYGVISYNPKTGVISSTATINNFGTSATGTYTMRWFLSKDQVVNNSDDITLKEVTISNSPEPGRSITRNDPLTVGYTIPDGAYFVGFAVDVNNQIPEPNDANNYQFTPSPAVVLKTEAILYTGTAGSDSVAINAGNDIAGRPQLLLVVNGVTIQRVNPYRASTIRILGLGGNDAISVADGITNPVYVDGGDGDDGITGGAGNDSLYGGAGRDSIRGGAGRDLIQGNSGNDQLFGEGGSDRLYGYTGSDFLDGGSGNARLDGGTSIDTYYGQSGNDTIYAHDTNRESIFGGSGTDSAQIDSLDIKSSIETILP